MTSIIPRCCAALLLIVLSLPPEAAKASPQLDSPQATMFEFLGAINQIELAQGDTDQAWSHVSATLDTPMGARTAALKLNEVLDKLGTIAPQDLPNAQQVKEADIGRYIFFPDPTGRFDWLREELIQYDNRWPDGQIVFVRGNDGQWRFSADTVAGIDKLAASLAPLRPRHAEPIMEDEPDQLIGMLGVTFAQTHWWQWASLAGCIFVGLVAGRLASYTLRNTGDRLIRKHWIVRGTVFHDLASPASLALFTAGLVFGLTSFIQLSKPLDTFVHRVAVLLFLIAAGWFLYNLIDVIEVGLRKITDKTDNKIDDMVVPLVRKTLRIFLVVVFILVVADNVFGINVTSFLAGLGIAGLAVSLAAQDSIKNLFGSLTVFIDKPFMIDDTIVFDGETGSVEEIGFRSTRIRLLNGHLVTVPNMMFIDGKVENISARPSIRRKMDVTITYDTPPEKIEQAVEILREILSDQTIVAEGRFDMENKPPRVAFTELNADSLNIRADYWYQMAGDPGRGFFTYLEHCQLVNMMLFKRYAEAGIEFAFPTQTLYLAGDPARELAVTVKQDGDTP